VLWLSTLAATVRASFVVVPIAPSSVVTPPSSSAPVQAAVVLPFTSAIAASDRFFLGSLASSFRIG